MDYLPIAKRNKIKNANLLFASKVYVFLIYAAKFGSWGYIDIRFDGKKNCKFVYKN